VRSSVVESLTLVLAENIAMLDLAIKKEALDEQIF
jgi:hypothetical protein